MILVSTACSLENVKCYISSNQIFAVILKLEPPWKRTLHLILVCNQDLKKNVITEKEPDTYLNDKIK